VGFLVPERHDKGVQAEVFVLEVEVGPNDGVVCEIGDSTDPELHGVFCWSVEDVGACGVVVMCLGLDAFDIRSMGKFSKRKPPNILQLRGPF
jgi:hypothetical protein